VGGVKGKSEPTQVAKENEKRGKGTRLLYAGKLGRIRKKTGLNKRTKGVVKNKT